MIFIPEHGSQLASRGNTWAYLQTLPFCFLTLTFYSSSSFGLPSIHIQTLVLLCYLQHSSPVGMLSPIRSYSPVCLVDPLLSMADWDSLLPKLIYLTCIKHWPSPTCMFPSLVIISLLAFPHLDAQLRHQQFSPLLLRIIRSIIALLVETSLFTSSSKTDTSL